MLLARLDQNKVTHLYRTLQAPQTYHWQKKYSTEMRQQTWQRDLLLRPSWELRRRRAQLHGQQNPYPSLTGPGSQYWQGVDDRSKRDRLQFF